jgi:hypothetical protein
MKCITEIKRFALIAISLCVLGCEKQAPLPENTALHAAQLVLAEGHLADQEPLKAIPYLLAPSHRQRLEQVLHNTAFHVPSHELLHPAPILHFQKGAGENLYVALGGKEPTVIRWQLGQVAHVASVLFPVKADNISHLAVCKNDKFLIVHRDEINLLCHADTLKPIAALPKFATSLHPEQCQVFSENSLLIASPSDGENATHLWHIADSATGEVIRSEPIPAFPKVLQAHFQNSSLCLAREDDTELQIPLHGEIKQITKTKTKGSPPNKSQLISQPTTNQLTLHQSLRLTEKEIESTSPEIISSLCGYELDPSSQKLCEMPETTRLSVIAAAFPETVNATVPSSSAAAAITQRLALASPQDYPELYAPQLAHAEIIYQTFLSQEPSAIQAVIAAAAPGLPASTALYLAIESKNPHFIQSALTQNPKAPPALHALALGKNPLPKIEFLQRTQDWAGYEAPDFSPLFLAANKQASQALAALEITESSSEKEIEELVKNLYAPITLKTLGRAILAEKAIAHAQFLSQKTAHAETAIGLSQLAEHHGANPTACLRARATSLTTLSRFKTAHQIWIDLITYHAEAAHLASDYSEAAHTAFETHNPSQAIEILKTGLFRFPRDTAFAIRAGWIALLSGYTAEARDFLLHATQLGLPPDEIENTTALLLIAHHKLGDTTSALSYLAQLQAISPKWSDPKAIKALAWPADFLKSLRETILQSSEN